MYRHILVPLDGSSLAESVLPQVEEFARRFGARITLLRATSLETIPTWVLSMAAIESREAEECAKQSCVEYLATVEQRLREHGLDAVESVVQLGPAVNVIADYAALSGADLIAMSSHGLGGLGRFLLGSVATSILQSTNVPVLLHHPRRSNWQPKMPYQRILVPLDGSELAETALPHVTSIARSTGAEVIILRVVPPQQLAELPVVAGEVVARARKDTLDYLEHVQRHMEEETVKCRWNVIVGSPADQIASVARNREVDLVVMATHGRSGLGRLVRGSVADAVVRNVSTPVLLTRSLRVGVSLPAALNDTEEAKANVR